MINNKSAGRARRYMYRGNQHTVNLSGNIETGRVTGRVTSCSRVPDVRIEATSEAACGGRIRSISISRHADQVSNQSKQSKQQKQKGSPRNLFPSEVDGHREGDVQPHPARGRKWVILYENGVWKNALLPDQMQEYGKV